MRVLLVVFLDINIVLINIPPLSTLWKKKESEVVSASITKRKQQNENIPQIEAFS